ncbi:hypothetical protein C8R47DRAFT_1120515 [Mycena vitilis]|nr:hypothetical protein C8R47DRAFT_1120515 [Mycena vitilis]
MTRSRRHPGPPSQLQRRSPDDTDQAILSSKAKERREWFFQNPDLLKCSQSDGTSVICGKCERKVKLIKSSGGVSQPWSRGLWNIHAKICSGTGFKTKQFQQRKEMLLHDPQAELIGERIRCRQCGHTMAHREYKLDVWKRHRAKCGQPRNPGDVAVAAASTPAPAPTPTTPAHAASHSDRVPSRKRRRRSPRRVFSTPLPDETGDELDVLGDPSQGPSHTPIDHPGKRLVSPVQPRH